MKKKCEYVMRYRPEKINDNICSPFDKITLKYGVGRVSYIILDISINTVFYALPQDRI